jgi:hypothetical protein
MGSLIKLASTLLATGGFGQLQATLTRLVLVAICALCPSVSPTICALPIR